MKQLILLVLFNSHVMMCTKEVYLPEIFVSIKVREQKRNFLAQLVAQVKVSMNDREQLLSTLPKTSPLLEDYKKQHYLNCEFDSKNGLTAIFSGAKSDFALCLKAIETNKLFRVLSGEGHYDTGKKYEHFCFSDVSSLITSHCLSVSDTDKKIYIRVIVVPAKRGLLDWFHDMFLKDGSENDIISSCHLMQGFVCDSSRLEEYRKKLIETLDVSLMYHYKEATYERIGMTDATSFLETTPVVYRYEVLAELRENEKKRLDRLKNSEKVLFPEESVRDACLENSDIQPEKREHGKKVLGDYSVIKEDEEVSDATPQAVVISASSHRLVSCVNRFNRLLEDRLSVSDESSSLSSCSSRITARYVDHAPSPLCLPVNSITRIKIIQIIP